jgi:hypothetical protein
VFLNKEPEVIAPAADGHDSSVNGSNADGGGEGRSATQEEETHAGKRREEEEEEEEEDTV